MKIALLGVGYVGSALKHSFESWGFDLTCVDVGWDGVKRNDVNQIDYKHLSSSFFYDFDAVILTAANSSVKSSEHVSSIQNNLINFIDLTSKLHPWTKFIYASSSSVYGNLDQLDSTEDTTEYRPMNLYDYSKMAADSYMQVSRPNFEWYGLRFGTVNGFSPILRTDIMMNAFYKSYKETGKINVFNGHIHRPVLGLQDLCRAIMYILQKGDIKKSGIYNLASFNHTVNELASISRNFLDCELNLQEGIGKVYDFSISTKKFEQAFGFEFYENPSTILHALSYGWDKAIKVDRNVEIIYK